MNKDFVGVGCSREGAVSVTQQFNSGRYLIGGCIQVRQGNVEQIVLQRVYPCRNGQFHGL